MWSAAPCRLKCLPPAEIILEGEIRLNDEAPEGPFGDHTGYYNAQEPFPIFHLKAITHRKNRSILRP